MVVSSKLYFFGKGIVHCVIKIVLIKAAEGQASHSLMLGGETYQLNVAGIIQE